MDNTKTITNEKSFDEKSTYRIGVVHDTRSKITHTVFGDDNGYYALHHNSDGKDSTERLNAVEAYDLFQTYKHLNIKSDGVGLMHLEQAYEMELAGIVNDAIKDYDPYDYADRVDDEPMAVVTILDDIDKGNVKHMVDTFQEMIDNTKMDAENDNATEIRAYSNIIKALSDFEGNRFYKDAKPVSEYVKFENDMLKTCSGFEHKNDKKTPFEPTLRDKLFDKIQANTEKAYGISSEIDKKGPEVQ